MIRKATSADVAQLTLLACEALNQDPFPGMRICSERVCDAVKECVHNEKHFVWVAEKDGELVGCVGAQVHPNLFYERNCASVMMMYCKKAPGDGIRLVRKFLEWARSKRHIKMIAFTLECKSDPRIGRMLTRMGFEVEMPMYIEVR